MFSKKKFRNVSSERLLYALECYAKSIVTVSLTTIKYILHNMATFSKFMEMFSHLVMSRLWLNMG